MPLEHKKADDTAAPPPLKSGAGLTVERDDTFDANKIRENLSKVNTQGAR